MIRLITILLDSAAGGVFFIRPLSNHSQETTTSKFMHIRKIIQYVRWLRLVITVEMTASRMYCPDGITSPRRKTSQLQLCALSNRNCRKLLTALVTPRFSCFISILELYDFVILSCHLFPYQNKNKQCTILKLLTIIFCL